MKSALEEIREALEACINVETGLYANGSAASYLACGSPEHLQCLDNERSLYHRARASLARLDELEKQIAAYMRIASAARDWSDGDGSIGSIIDAVNETESAYWDKEDPKAIEAERMIRKEIAEAEERGYQRATLDAIARADWHHSASALAGAMRKGLHVGAAERAKEKP